MKQMADALVAKAEEGRGRLRKVLGSRQQTLIQRCPNRETLVGEIGLIPTQVVEGKSGN